MGTRKRSAAILLEKPLVSRLRFDRELAECERHLPSDKQRRIFVDSSSENHSCRTASLQVADSNTVFLAHAEKRRRLGAATEEDATGTDPSEVEWCPWDVPREKRNGEAVLAQTTADGDAEVWNTIWGRAGPSLLGRRGDQSQSQDGAGGGRDKPSKKETEKEVEADDQGKLSLAIWLSKLRLYKYKYRLAPAVGRLEVIPILIPVDTNCVKK